MTRDSTRARNAAEDDDWIFAAADPGTLPTEELPDREAFDRHATPLLARPERPAQPVATRDHGTYARSGTTPSAEGAIELRGLTLPARFAELGFWDAARDLLALLCLIAAASTQFVVRDIGWWTVVPQSAIALSVLALVGVHCLRWIPRDPDLPTIRRLRVIGQIPAITVAVLIILADLVLSLPVLFSPLEQVPLGVGVGVSLLLVGAIVAIEPRRHEGWTPQEVSRRRMIAVLRGLGWAAAVLFALSLVMAVGRAFTTGWPFALTSFANSGLSALVLTVALASALQRDRSRFVFVTAAIGGLVIAALADNSLRMQFAAPLSVAIGFVYLPLLFTAFAVMISRSFLRTMPLSFRRSDWIVYAVRAFEFGIVVHLGAVGWQLLVAVAAIGGGGVGGPVLHAMGAVVSAVVVVLCMVGRQALLERPADNARAMGVGAAVVMVVLGFLAVIVNSLATGAGAGLVTGGVALAIGIAAALMLTVPSPVRDEYGAPDLGRMFEDFRIRDQGHRRLADRVPDVTAERARKKSFPAG